MDGGKYAYEPVQTNLVFIKYAVGEGFFASTGTPPNSIFIQGRMGKPHSMPCLFIVF
jgi:hypothetical protein